MLNPILTSSAVRRMRSIRLPLVLLGYAIMMTAIAYVGYAQYMDHVFVTMLGQGNRMHGILIMLQCVLLVLISPAMTSGAIAGERERQTLEMLLVTRTGAYRIVMGKLLESMMSLVLVVLCGLPAMCLNLLLGGVTVSQILLTECYLIALAFAAGAIGVFASSLCRTTMVSTIVSYILILLIGFLGTLPAFLGYTQRVTDVLYDQQQYDALTAAGCMRLFSPVFYFEPGIGAASLLLDQTNLLYDMFLYRSWGRILATYMMMQKIGFPLLVLLNIGGMTLMGLFFSLIAALRVRRVEGRRRGKRR